ncbi:MAG: peptide-methionine (S)-S-oxide reductase MsrA [Cyclobacteriaceae bacterium]
MKYIINALASLFALAFLSCGAQKPDDSDVRRVDLTAPGGKAVAAFASGCFWCSEHVFEAVVGVDSAISGYAGGNVPDPSYELVNTETTGHAETVLVYYNPQVVSYDELTKVFFTSHDPTTRNRQGPDIGSSYRSIIFYNSPAEKASAEKAVKDFASSFKKPIVTEIKSLTAFYRAEGYHQDYIHHNPDSPYVKGVSIPRYEKFLKTYKGKLKE